MSLPSRMIVVLTTVGILSGAVLALVGLLTQKRIALNKQREIEQAVIHVIPGSQSSQKLYEERDYAIYGGIDGGGKILGLAIQATASGFQDKIVLILGTNTAVTKINRLYVLEQKETPGLGAKISDRESFLMFWENKDCRQPLSLRKPAVDSPDKLAPSEVNTITGATISSQAVLSSVNSSIEKTRKLKQEGKLGEEVKNASKNP